MIDGLPTVLPKNLNWLEPIIIDDQNYFNEKQIDSHKWCDDNFGWENSKKTYYVEYSTMWTKFWFVKEEDKNLFILTWL